MTTATVSRYATKLDPNFVERMRKQPVPWGPLGYVTYKRTYARLREDLGRTEEWADTVERCVNAVLRYGCQMTKTEAETAFEYIHQLKCTPPGRMLWQLGTSTVDRIGGDSLCNCWLVAVDDIESFCFAFDELMLGGGVGFSILPSHVYKLPQVKAGAVVVRRDGNDVDFIVPDNREGWVELLRRTLRAYFETGRGFSYSTHCVRSKGERIKGFGGVASGPGDLVKGINQIGGVLSSRAGKHLRPIDALDIMNIIGSVVVSGNVRRSAQLALGAADDTDFLQAKQWAKGIPNWRAMSNNTVARDRFDGLGDDFWSGYRGEGEPYGLANLGLMRTRGRLRDGDDCKPDTLVQGCNPCAEQQLEDGEACDLFELFLSRLRSRQEFVTAAKFGHKFCKTALSLPFSWPKTKEVIARNQRMGVSVSGFCQSKFEADDYETVYKAVQDADRKYSKRLGVSPSIRLTTVKPSGTVSLLPGCTPGVHPAYSRHYIRRIRFSANDPIVNACRSAGYPVESQVGFDGAADHDTQIVSFPVDVGPETTTASQVSAIDQLEKQSFLQTHWSDNCVSVTVYYRDEELPEIKEWLSANYEKGVKTVSFLRHSDHGFKQAPYEEITAAQYDEMSKQVKPLTSLTDAQQWDLVDSMECSSGACPVK
jgi:ribonucleoside-triphosphate reductase